MRCASSPIPKASPSSQSTSPTASEPSGHGRSRSTFTARSSTAPAWASIARLSRAASSRRILRWCGCWAMRVRMSSRPTACASSTRGPRSGMPCWGTKGTASRWSGSAAMGHPSGCSSAGTAKSTSKASRATSRASSPTSPPADGPNRRCARARPASASSPRTCVRCSSSATRPRAGRSTSAPPMRRSSVRRVTMPTRSPTRGRKRCSPRTGRACSRG